MCIRLRLAGFLMFSLIALGSATGGRAAVFNVTDATDLQAALTTSGSNGENDTIHLAAGLYSSTGLSYLLSSGDDNNTLLLQGAGASSTILDFGGFSNFVVSTSGLADDSNAHVTIRGLTIRNGDGCRGGGLEMGSSSADMTLEHNFFVDNVSCDGDGGGAYVTTNSGALSIINCVFSRNAHGVSGDDGGGVYVQTISGAIVLSNNTVTSNATNSGRGDGIAVWLLEDSASASLFNNIVRGNGAEDIYVNDDGFGNGTGASTALFNNDYSTFSIQVGDNLTQGGNIDQDPLLTGDFHLPEGSPAIDVGDNGAPLLPSSDLDGEARIMNGTVDMGVDEYPGPQIAVIEIPTLSSSGLILLLLLAGLGPLLFMRRLHARR